MMTSETAQHKSLYEALMAAQADFPEIPKDKENPYFKSKYSTLDAIKTACWPVLHRHGILPRHKLSQSEDQLTVTFELRHIESGEVDENSLTMKAALSVQEIGSQITYLRRYTCVPALGICSDEDDDGNGATPPPQRKPAAKNPPQPKAETNGTAKPQSDHDRYVAKAQKRYSECSTVEQVLEVMGDIAWKMQQANADKKLRTECIMQYVHESERFSPEKLLQIEQQANAITGHDTEEQATEVFG